MDTQILAVELNESFVLLALLFCSLFSSWAESMTLRRYKRKWDKQKVEALSEIATLSYQAINTDSYFDYEATFCSIFKIAVEEIKREPWFALEQADKLLQNRKFVLFKEYLKNRKEKK